MLRVLFAGSGSGGHLRPALALARALANARPGSEIAFFTPGAPLEGRFFAGVPWTRVALGERRRRRSVDLPGLATAGRAIRAAIRFDAHLAVGTGGGPGVAPLLAACARRVPLLLLEPNVVAGRANRLLARFATAVLSQHAETVASLPRGVRLETSGTPLREDLECGLSKSQARARFGLDPAVRTILVTGGSQGAESLNEKFAAAAVALGASAVPMQVLHVTGDGKDPGYARRLESAGVRARVLPFVEDMPVAYRAADLVASRSGGSTLAEIAALALPSVLAPFPWHRDRHQERNAEIFVRAGASRMFFDARESAERLAAILSELLGDGGAALRPMEAAAAALGRPSATRDAVRLAIVLAESRAAVAASSRGTPAFAGGGGR